MTDYTIPRANAPIAGQDAPTTQWYNFLRFLDTRTSSAAGDVQAEITTIATKLGSPDGTVDNIPALGNVTSVQGRQSIASSGISVVQLRLVNDADVVSPIYYYGTDSTGTKGYNLLYSAFASTANIAKINTAGIVSFDLTDLTDSGVGMLLATTFDAKGRKTGSRAATITGTAGRITVANGDASAGLPTIDLATLPDAGGGVLLAIARDTFGRASGTHAVTVTGTTNQVNVSGGTGSGSAITLSTPQDIAATSTPTFAQVSVAADPTTALQLTTKQYVDSVAAGLSPKAPTLLATTTNDTLSGLAARDGFTPSLGSRVLVKNQTLPAQNGIYIASASAWTRATDMATWAQVPSAYLWVEEGTVNADTGWVCTSDPGGVIGVTAITFVQFGGNGTVTAGAGITVAGNQVSLGTPSTLTGATTNTATGTTHTHALTLAKSDVGLGNVDNTSDAAKPVSSAQAAADALNVPLDGSRHMTGELTNDNGRFTGSASYAVLQAAPGAGGYIYLRPVNGSVTNQTFIDAAGNYSLGGVRTATGYFAPGTDNLVSIGTSGFRFSVVYAATGTINTSDARDKTEVVPLSDAEISASSEMARAIGTYQWLAQVAAKGASSARYHAGLTVQQAIAIMQAHGLDPMRYGFICYDSWPETPEVIDSETGEVMQAYRPSGDRYSFRHDELLLFIARGFAARLDALEAST